MLTKVLYSINRYDRDGDISEEGIYLHFEDTIIKVADNIKDFDKFCEQIIDINKEVQEWK